jgi:predicted nucleic acid-binding protein
VSAFVLDASYTLTWCFPDRATPATDATLKRMESGGDHAVVPWVWQLEVGNALGKAVTKGKVDLARALELWNELLVLPIRQVAIGNVPQLIELAVKNNLSLYDTCYLQAALVLNIPLATNDQKLRRAAETEGLAALTP